LLVPSQSFPAVAAGKTFFIRRLNVFLGYVAAAALCGQIRRTTSVYVRGEDERRVDKNAILFVVAPMGKVSTCSLPCKSILIPTIENHLISD
jgi:hypothetical protein